MQPDRRFATATPVRSDQQTATEIGRDGQFRAATERRERDLVAEAHEEFLRRLDRVSHFAPVARTAWALLTNHCVPPVPLDGDLEPAGDALETAEQVLEHYRLNPDHGAGVATGKHPSRDWTYVGVKVDTWSAWQAWLKTAATVVTTRPNLGGFADVGGMTETGTPIEIKTVRDSGAYARLLWAPPPLPQMKHYVMDAAGSQLDRLMDARKVGRGGWILFAVPDPDGRLKVRRDRKLADGVRVLSTGTVVPWDGSKTADRWSLVLNASAGSKGGLAPSHQPPAPWLVQALTNG